MVVGRPEDFTNEWAYTALSRARDPVHVHLTAERDDRSDRSEIAPSPPERTAEEAIDAMRMAMRRREREKLAIDQAAPLGAGAVPGEAAAEANERAQRQQLALDFDRDAGDDRSRCPRCSEPFAGPSHSGRRAPNRHGRARQRGHRARPHDPWSTFRARRSSSGPSDWTRCSRRSPTTGSRRRDERTSSLDSANEHARPTSTIGEQLSTAHRLGPLSRIFGRHEREFTEQALASWTERAHDYDERSQSSSASTPTATSAQPGSTSTATSSSSRRGEGRAARPRRPGARPPHRRHPPRPARMGHRTTWPATRRAHRARAMGPRRRAPR